MDVLVYGNTKDEQSVKKLISRQASMAFRKICYTQTEDYDEFLIRLEEKNYDMVIIMTDNAAGMEGVIAVKNMLPHIPVLWFTNDKNFVAQSYRLGVTYFSVKPIEERTMKLALERCQRREELV